MLIKTITFEVKASEKNRFEEKFHNDHISLQNWETCLGSEIWIQNKVGADTVAFTAVSRWNNHEDFNAWLKRPEHEQRHQKLRKEHRFDKNEKSPIVSKTAHEYTVLGD
ncbi:antibiotic biosynthesis monooxygenase family protein [Streptococcus gallolyticus]|uniref:ABM domain-containing protein n=1 Tax=Streptococcus gallolyticus TaxID=315405 RepID=A0A139R2Z5_9STRE|nr:antibiotic biosynthesis monooxygenase [Streptococcus gallolyticus]KXT64425.1 hypothetical protein SGADD02_02055 [Streptococcus gallolyticus]KXU09152.1 hypothetical protein SGADD03_01007 [Streptococcus gallolyticus]